MRSSLALLLLLLLAAPAVAREPAPTPEQAAVLNLPATGPKRDCVQLREVQETVPAGPRAILFRLGANRWLRNDLPAACPLNRDRIMIVRNTGVQLCRGDVVGVVEPVSRINYGLCALGDYTPVALPKGFKAPR